jgi:hypothetical protein
LNFGQSSSNHETQPPQPTKALVAHEFLAHFKGKAQIKQVYVLKKEEMPVALTQEVAPPASITIGSAKVPITKINETIVIEDERTLMSPRGGKYGSGSYILSAVLPH